LPLVIRANQRQAIASNWIFENYLPMWMSIVLCPHSAYSELHLLQRVTHKSSWTVIIFLRVVIFYGQRSARDQLVWYIWTIFDMDIYNIISEMIFTRYQKMLGIENIYRRGMQKCNRKFCITTQKYSLSIIGI